MKEKIKNDEKIIKKFDHALSKITLKHQKAENKIVELQAKLQINLEKLAKEKFKRVCEEIINDKEMKKMKEIILEVKNERDLLKNKTVIQKGFEILPEFFTFIRFLWSKCAV